MTSFFDTQIGKQLCESTLPELVIELRRLADGVHTLAHHTWASPWLAKASSTSARDSRKRVLLVDDDPKLLAGVQRMLKERYTVAVATSVIDALRLLASEPFDAIVSDFSLGTPLTGADLLTEVQAHWPHMRRLLSSGRAPTTMETYVDDGIAHAFLPKPANRDTLIAAIETTP